MPVNLRTLLPSKQDAVSVSFHLGSIRHSAVPGDFMARPRKNRTLEGKNPTSLEQNEPANGNQREYQEWIRRCALDLKKTDGLSSAQRFFCAAFSLLFAGKERAELDRQIDGTIDAETSEENLRSTLQNRLRTCGAGSRVRTNQYVAGYFAADEKRNREKRFHDAVLFLFHEGFTREELHRFAAQAEET